MLYKQDYIFLASFEKWFKNISTKLLTQNHKLIPKNKKEAIKIKYTMNRKKGNDRTRKS